jgi:misacylated tRNA(Ala) deacylase
MMTQLLAQTDAYLKEFDAAVVAVHVEENAVALDKTAFYPGGGGQLHDLGWLDDMPVNKVKRQGEHIWHYLEYDLPVVGTTLHGKLDWDRRYKLMRTHTAFHILCGVVWCDYKAQATGGNMDVLKGRMDFELTCFKKISSRKNYLTLK